MSVHDDVDAELAGHRGTAYTSPPQPREQALALSRCCSAPRRATAERPRRWTRAIAGGRRTITLAPVDATTQSLRRPLSGHDLIARARAREATRPLFTGR